MVRKLLLADTQWLVRAEMCRNVTAIRTLLLDCQAWTAKRGLTSERSRYYRTAIIQICHNSIIFHHFMNYTR